MRHRLLLVGLGAARLVAVLVSGLVTTLPPGPATAMQVAGGGESNPFAVASADASASFFTGAATVSVPILIPPGRRLATPSLSLGYSSQVGMGPAGFGWSFPVGVLARSLASGVPRCDGADMDAYRVTLSASSNELVEDTPDLYLFAIDEAYTEARPDRAANRWVLRTREGMTYVFGGGAAGESRVFSGDDVFHDPMACAFTTEWHLTRVEDPNGNGIDIAYEKAGQHPIPVRIEYGGNAAAGIAHPYRVRLETEDLVSLGRPLVRRFVAGADQRLERRIRAIVVEGRTSPAAPWVEIRRYELGYDDSLPTQEFLLESVAATDLPTRRFDYSTSMPTIVASQSEPLDDPDTLGTHRSNGPTMQMMDLNGDGLLDRLCVRGGAWHAAYGDPSNVQFTRTAPCSNTSGNWNVPTDTGTSLNRISRQDHGVDTFTTIDLDGDGIPDLVRRDEPGGTIRVYRGACTSAFECGFDDVFEVWNNPGPSPSLPLRWTSAGDRGQQTRADLVDMNGDGRVDIVRADASTGDWLVYPNTGSGFEVEPLVYADVDPLIAYASNPDHNAEAERQLIDVNGDGLPDRVSAPVHDDPLSPSKRVPTTYFAVDEQGGLHGPWTLGSGPYLCPMPGDFEQATLCANPAALPSGWAIVGATTVRLNTGAGFAEPIHSPSPFWRGGHESANRLRGTWTESASRETHTFRDFADLNGDGRVDQVVTGYAYDGSSDWHVLYNLGDGRFGGALEVLQPAAMLAGPDPGIFLGEVRPAARLAGLGPYMGRTFTHVNPGDRSDLQIVVLDVDADGLAEKVRSVGIGASDRWDLLTLRFEDEETPHQRPLLLTRVHDGVGGTTRFRYAPSSDFVGGALEVPGLPFVTWVVTGIRRTDGLCDLEATDWFDASEVDPGNACLAAGHEVVQRIEYAEGLFDAEARAFRGFGRVRVQDGPGRTGSVRELTYGQSEALAGKLLREDVLVGGVDLLSRTSVAWRTLEGGPRTRLFALEQRVEHFTLYPPMGESGGRCVVHRSSIRMPDGVPDPMSRVHTACSMRCDGAGDPDEALCEPRVAGKKQIETVYASPVPSATTPVWDRPERITSSWVDEAGASRLTSETRFEYDGLGAGLVDRGRPTRERRRVDVAADDWIEKQLEYDEGDPVGPGNVTAVGIPRDLASVPTRIEFDPTWRLFAVAELMPETAASDGRPVVHRIERRHDLGTGRVDRTIGLQGLSAGDVSGAVLDSLGRPLCEYEPGTSCEGTDALGLRRTLHHDGDPDAAEPLARMSSVEIRRLEPNAPGGYLTTRSYWDALGRERLTTNEQVVGAPGTGLPGRLETVVVRHLEYGPHGRVVRRFAPYVASSGYGLEAPAGAAAERSSYVLNGNPFDYLDPAGRVFERTRFDGATPRTWYLGDRVRTVDGLESPTSTGNHVVERLDEHGRTITREVYEGAGSELLVRIDWRHDGADRVVEEFYGGDPSTAIRKAWDGLGRLVETRDPDSGVWLTRFDAHDNPIFVDDPEPGRAVQICYDALDRAVLRCGRATDDFDPDLCASSAPVCTDRYDLAYDDAGAVSGEPGHAIGRLSRVVGTDSTHRFAYDVRGRMTVRVDAVLGIAGTTRFDHHPQLDRLEGLVYPDGEIVAFGYDAAGAPRSVAQVDDAGRAISSIVSEASYDASGRLLYLRRGNLTEDHFAYHGPEQDHRLASIRSERVASRPGAGPDLLVDLRYPAYDGNGRLLEVVDGLDASGGQSMSAVYAYDGAGRLTTVSGPQPEAFEYDAIGNMTRLNGRAIGFDRELAGGTAPHRAIVVADDGSGAWLLGYDANGQRTSKWRVGGAEFQSYEWDAFGALRRIAVDGVTKRLGYDHTGQRVSESRGGRIRRHFGPHAVSEDGRLSKEYYLGTRLVAVRSTEAPELSGLESPSARRIALPVEAYWGVVLGAAGLLLVPLGPGRRTLGLRIAASGGLGSALLVAAGVLPLALATTACAGDLYTRHYHLDHLGSPVALSAAGGSLDRLYRYSAYGEVRRYDGAGHGIGIDAASRREFTGHATDPESGLQYAGARYYDPSLARFLSPDPAEVAADPWAYVGWDPINQIDPNGTNPWLIAGLLALAFLAVVANAVMNAIRTGSAGVFFRDFAIGWASMGAGLLVGIVAPSAIAVPIELAGVGQSLYSLATAKTTQGIVFAGVGLGLAIMGLAYGLHASGKEASGAVQPPVEPEGGGFDETVPVRSGVEVAGTNDANVAAMPGRALIKLSNDRINGRIAEEIAMLRTRAAAGEFGDLQVAAWEVRTVAHQHDLGVTRIVSGSVHVAARPTGTPGFPDAFAPDAFLGPIGTTTAVSRPIWIAGSSWSATSLPLFRVPTLREVGRAGVGRGGSAHAR
ncbi:MAG: toxin TcdB middle/N-terminal domain-containing protein [Myxococcota bacterium]